MTQTRRVGESQGWSGSIFTMKFNEVPLGHQFSCSRIHSRWDLNRVLKHKSSSICHRILSFLQPTRLTLLSATINCRRLCSLLKWEWIFKAKVYNNVKTLAEKAHCVQRTRTKMLLMNYNLSWDKPEKGRTTFFSSQSSLSPTAYVFTLPFF